MGRVLKLNIFFNIIFIFIFSTSELRRYPIKQQHPMQFVSPTVVQFKKYLFYPEFFLRQLFVRSGAG
jgi:hypothetical protein